MSVKPGQALGQYQIVEQIGKGGMATVFRSWQPSLARHVAIKVLPEFFTDDPSFQHRFRQEAVAIAQLRHPNVLTVFDSGESDGVAYIVTELVEGGTLAGRLGRVLSIDECVALLGPVASALDYAHARGMVHRDVKPANILLGPDGVPILSDFGLARMAGQAGGDAATRLTMVGSTIGTPEYMAPEQIESSDVGPAADIYSLAVILYEMLTGSVPYTGDTPVSVLMARLQKPLPPPRERNPSLPAAVQDVLVKGLARNPAERYGSAGEMLRALEAAGRTASSGPPASTKSASWIAAAVVVIAVAVAGLVMWSRTRTPPVATTVASAPGPARAAAAPEPRAVPPPAAAPAAPVASTPKPAVTSAPPAPAPVAAARLPVAAAAVSDGLPPHGKLLYAFVEKDAPRDIVVENDVGTPSRLEVEGVADFVAVLKYIVTDRRPVMTFRFRQARQGAGLAARWPAFLSFAPAGAGAAPSGQHSCCLPVDMFVTPQRPNGPTIFAGVQPVTLPAKDREEQVVVVSAVGPVVTMFAGDREIARTTEAPAGPGGMTLNVLAGRADLPASVRLTALDIYEPRTAARTPATSTMPAHGSVLFALADHLTSLAQLPQPPDNTISVNGTSLDLKVGGDGQLALPLGVTGIGDFIALLKFAPLALRPMLRFRFGGVPRGDHMVQIPAFLRLGASADGVSSGPHPCCQEFDVFRLPQAQGIPTLFTGPAPRAVGAAMNQEQAVTISVKGPVIVVSADGQEIARVTDDALKPGGIALEVGARRQGPGPTVPSIVRLTDLQIYQQP